MKSYIPRLAALLLVPLLAHPTTARAQEFKGLISMDVTMPSSEDPLGVKLYTDGSHQAVRMVLPATGVMAERQINIVAAPEKNEVATFLPLPTPEEGDAKGVKRVITLPEAMAPPKGYLIAKLDNHRTIAGVECTDYKVTTLTGTFMMCATSQLGRYALPDLGPDLTRRDGQPRLTWIKAFGRQTLFPLKVWDTPTGLTMEVTAVRAGAIPEGAFALDRPGYTLIPS